MEYWEFLIQKEGDRSWLPLESPDVEILEGRYRVVARSSRANEAMEVRVTHQSVYEELPKRRVQKRNSRTNSEGLIVIIPFTLLKPGIWDFYCSGEANSEAVGNTWQQGVRLQVLPSETDEFDLDSAAPAATPSAESTGLMPAPEKGEAVAPLTQSDKDSRLQQKPATAAKAKPTQTGAAKVISQELPDKKPPAVAPSPGQAQQSLQLALNRSAYTLRQGQAVTLSGRVEVSSSGAARAPVRKAQLHVQLRDPQSAQVVVDVRHSLPELQPPVPFACAVEIPPQFQTNLLLGEISLYYANAVVDAKSISITPEASQLLGAISQELQEELYNVYNRQTETVDDSFQQLMERLQNPQPVQFQPSVERTLPPQLYKPNTEKPANKPLDLPTFPRVNPNAQSKQPSAKKTPAELTNPAADSESGAELVPDRTEEESGDKAEPTVPEISAIASQEAPQETPSQELLAFQSLKVQERFLTRLNSLANDAELTEWLKIDLMPTEEATPITAEASEESESAKPKPAAYWESQEIVIDEEPAPGLAPVAKPSPIPSNTKTADAFDASVLPEDDPVPTPIIGMRETSAIAGRPMTIYARLPDLVPRIYVKLWIQDRQSRTILDGPHWLTEFSINAWGDKEGTIQLIVPYGSLEISIEAIAMEMQTQRESHKSSVAMQVMPPAPPTLPLG